MNNIGNFNNNHLNSSEKEKIATLIENVKNELLNSELEDIYEITFKYEKKDDNIRLNETLFLKFLGEQSTAEVKENAFNTIGAYFLRAKKKLEEKIQKIDDFEKEFESLNNNDPMIKSIQSTLDHSKKILQLTLLGLEFEAEKAGMDIYMSDDERDERIQKMDEIQKELFGGKVSENPDELIQVMKELKSLGDKNKDTLDQNEQETYSKYVQLFENKFSEFLNNTEKTETKKDVKVKKNILHTQELFKEKIKRDEYVTIFEIIYELYGIKKGVAVESVSSVYDGTDNLYIPDSESYENLTVKRILELIVHEVEVHGITEYNNSAIKGGNIRDGGYLRREESLAMTMEGIFNGTYNPNDIGPGTIRGFAGENLEGPEFKEFLRLYCKLKGHEEKYIGLYERAKRLYPDNRTGVQNKDSEYARGKGEIADYVNNTSNSPEDLFLGKVTVEQIENLKQILENKGTENKDLKKQLKYPVFIGELLLFALSGEKVTKENFLNYLYEKYPYLKNINKETGDLIADFTFAQKRKILEIINNMSGSVKRKNLNK